MCASIWRICFHAECHTTVLWNWKRKSSFLWSYSSRQCCWEHVPVSVLWIPHHYVSAETKEYISTKLLKDWLHVENVQWGGSSDSNRTCCHSCNTLATCCEAVKNCCTGGATGVFSCHWLGFIQSLEKMVS